MEKTVNTLELTNVVHFKKVFTKEQCEQITQDILDYKSKSQSWNDYNSNAGCWRGKPQEKGGIRPELNQLIITKIAECCREFQETLTHPISIRTENTDYMDKTKFLFNAWVNVNEPGAENREHTHSGNLISGCVYFQSTGTGPIEFIPQNVLYRQTHPAWPFHGYAEYEPEDGDIIVFPSYLLHKVAPNPSNKQRINMAFNVDFKPIKDFIA